MRCIICYIKQMNLSDKKCAACEGGTPPLEAERVKEYMAELNGGWGVLDKKKIKKEFKFKNFKEAIIFVNKIAEIAESEGHHPDIHIFYNQVIIELWTHAVGGLSENDFIMASKIDKLIL